MKKVAFCTLGCRVNQYESRALAELFVKKGYKPVPFGEKCDICIVNTCAVTAESERKSAQLIRRASKLAEDVRVCGCYVAAKGGVLNNMPFVSKAVGCVGKSTLADETPRLTEKGFELMDIATVDQSELGTVSAARAYVKIQDGCNGKCTYCIIPSLRGKVRSRPVEDILAEAKRLVAGGCKEIILTGIETAAYNFLPLPRLIERIGSIEDLCRLRLGSLDPNAINDGFIEAAKRTEVLMPHFHISLQSGCDRILKLMGRPYKAEEAKRRLLALKEAIPGVMLSADIICSFPSETEEELEETIAYLKSIGFMHIHAFSYSRRPHTPAAEMDGQIPEELKRERMHRLLAECQKMERDAHLSKTGQVDTVLIEKATEGGFVGHTADFCEAFIESEAFYKEGDLVPVIVKDYIKGKLVCEIKDQPLYCH